MSAKLSDTLEPLQKDQKWAIDRQAEIRQSLALLKKRNDRKRWFFGIIGIAFFGLLEGLVRGIESGLFFCGAWLLALGRSSSKVYWQRVLSAYSPLVWRRYRYQTPDFELPDTGTNIIYTFTCILDILAINRAIPGDKILIYPQYGQDGPWLVRYLCQKSGFIPQTGETLTDIEPIIQELKKRLAETPNVAIVSFIYPQKTLPPKAELNPLVGFIGLNFQKPAKLLQLVTLDHSSLYRSLWTHLSRVPIEIKSAYIEAGSGFASPENRLKYLQGLRN